jgi:hypothetical protein
MKTYRSLLQYFKYRNEFKKMTYIYFTLKGTEDKTFSEVKKLWCCFSFTTKKKLRLCVTNFR